GGAAGTSSWCAEACLASYERAAGAAREPVVYVPVRLWWYATGQSFVGSCMLGSPVPDVRHVAQRRRRACAPARGARGTARAPGGGGATRHEARAGERGARGHARLPAHAR